MSYRSVECRVPVCPGVASRRPARSRRFHETQRLSFLRDCLIDLLRRREIREGRRDVFCKRVISFITDATDAKHEKKRPTPYAYGLALGQTKSSIHHNANRKHYRTARTARSRRRRLEAIRAGQMFFWQAYTSYIRKEVLKTRPNRYGWPAGGSIGRGPYISYPLTSSQASPFWLYEFHWRALALQWKLSLVLSFLSRAARSTQT